MRRFSVLVTVLSAVALLAPGAVAADPDDPAGSGEAFPGEGVVAEDAHQHGEESGHLPAVSENVDLVGKAEVTNPVAGASNDGRVADVAAYGNYAFLTAFRNPVCEKGGAHVIDISDPANPVELPGAFMETTQHNYAGEGAQTLAMNTPAFQGVVFIHQNETCPGAPAPTAPATRGGIHIWDITNPASPQLLVAHAGDYTNPAGGMDTQANSTHSAFAWNDKEDGKTYAVLVDNEETADLDILDITDPRNPVLVNDTLDLDAPPFNVGQSTPSNLTSSFSHDMVVKRVGERYVMAASYWDGGYVLLDVTDPTSGNVTLIAESDYAALDEERLARGHEISPEGNGHQSELSPDNRFLVATDEDFGPYRVVAKITSGPYAGTEYTATSASGTPPIDENTSIVGTPTFVGLACNTSPPPAGTGIALIERGVCTFQEKFNNMKAAGYSSGIVFNSQNATCLQRVTMLASGDRPFVFVDRLTGLQLLQVAGVNSGNACATVSPAAGSPVASTSIEAIFDGWGYIRLFRTQIPGDIGTTGSISQVDTHTVPEAQDPAYARGFGTLSVHEVAMDPNPGKKLAYISYYSAGFRVLQYGNSGLTEVGAFIDEGGNNFWGVEVHKVGKQQYVLASDRDFGLYIFQPQV